MSNTRTVRRAELAAQIGAGLRTVLTALPVMIGLLALMYGLWLAWPPLAWIVAGLLLIIDRRVT